MKLDHHFRVDDSEENSENMKPLLKKTPKSEIYWCIGGYLLY